MKSTKLFLLLVHICLGSAAALAADPRPLPTNAPPLVQLSDQHGALQKLAFPSTNITLLTIADRKGSEQVDGWIAALKPHCAGRIDIRGLADCGGAPSFIQGRIRKKFQEARQYPVMMDWTGQTCARFGYEPGKANLLVLGPDGAIQARFAGEATQGEIRKAKAALDKAWAERAKAKDSPGPTPPVKAPAP